MGTSEYVGPVIGVIEPGPSLEEIWGAVGVEVWKLAPQEYQDSGHRDLKFLTNWQDIMGAVHGGLVNLIEEYEEARR